VATSHHRFLCKLFGFFFIRGSCRPLNTCGLTFKISVLVFLNVLFNVADVFWEITSCRPLMNKWVWSTGRTVLTGENRSMLERNLFHCHLFQYKFRTYWPGIEPAPSWLITAWIIVLIRDREERRWSAYRKCLFLPHSTRCASQRTV